MTGTDKEIEAGVIALEEYINSYDDYTNQSNATSKDAYIYNAVKKVLKAAEAVREEQNSI